MSEFDLLKVGAAPADFRVESERRRLRRNAKMATAAAVVCVIVTVLLAAIAGDNRWLGLATWLVASPTTPVAIALAAAHRVRASRRRYRARGLVAIGLTNFAFVAFGVWRALDVSRRFF